MLYNTKILRTSYVKIAYLYANFAYIIISNNKNNNLYVSFLSPKEVYDKIVVIDPACGGGNDGLVVEGIREKDITLEIAQKLKEKLDKGYKLAIISAIEVFPQPAGPYNIIENILF